MCIYVLWVCIEKKFYLIINKIIYLFMCAESSGNLLLSLLSKYKRILL